MKAWHWIVDCYWATREWLTWKIRGRKYISGVDYGNNGETIVTFGFIDRKGDVQIQHQCTMNGPEIMKAFMSMGVSAQQFATAMGEMAKAFPSVKDIQESTDKANEAIFGKPGHGKSYGQKDFKDFGKQDNNNG